MSIWQWFLRLLGLSGGSRPDGRAGLSATVAEMLEKEAEERKKLAQAEAERAQLRKKDELLRQALQRKEQEAGETKDPIGLQRSASDIVHLRRERDGLNQQITLWESLRSQVQTVLMSLAQLRVLSQQQASAPEIAELTTQLERLLSQRRETEAALDTLRIAAVQPVAQDVDVERELQRLQAEAGGEATPPSTAAAPKTYPQPAAPPANNDEARDGRTPA